MAYTHVYNAGSIGIVKDIQPQDLSPEAWTDGKNVRINGFQVEIMTGHDDAYNITVSAGVTATQNPAITAWWLQAVNTGDNTFWIYAGQNKVYAADSTSNDNNITRQSATSTASITSTSPDKDYSATQNMRWNGAVLAGIPIINNSVDPPQKWTPVSTSQRLQELDWDTSVGTKWSTRTAGAVTAKVFRAYREYGIALDTTENGTRHPRRIRWSHPAEPNSVPETWDETDTTRDAGFFDLDDTGDVVIDCLTLRDVNFIYKENTTWMQQFVGGQFVHNFKKAFLTVGALSRDCVAEFFGKHLVLTPSDLVVHDGVNVDSIIEKRWKNFLFNDIEGDFFENTYLAVDHESYEIWICYPVAGQSAPWPTRALIWNWKNNTYSVRDLDNFSHIEPGKIEVIGGSGSGTLDTWASITGTWETQTIGWNQQRVNPSSLGLLAAKGTDTKLFALNFGNTFDGEIISSFVERSNISLDSVDRNGNIKVDPTKLKYVRALWPHLSAGVGTVINIRVGKQDHFNGPITYDGPFPFTAGQAIRVNTDITGRFVAVRFESSATVKWAVNGYTLDYDVVGRF